MSDALASSPVTFHLSVNVADIDRSVEFFSKVFGMPPTKHRNDYAKFELQNPPLTFSLEPVSPSERGVLNHVGFKFQSAEELVTFQRRLEMAGLNSEREEGVECCYAKQTKFWLHDPNGTLWEMYVLEGDLEHRGAGQSSSSVMDSGVSRAPSEGILPINCASAPATQTERTTWSHRLGDSLSIPVEYASESLDEIALQGSFNGEGTSPQIRSFLSEVWEQLKPGGKVSIHCLTADRHVEELPQLPGPASVVKQTPCLESLLSHLDEAGFECVRLTKYGSRACFTAGEAELRETKIEAMKPVQATDDLVTVVYRGPFREIELKSDVKLQRGCRTEISRTFVEQVQSTSVADSIVIIETATSPVACTR